MSQEVHGELNLHNIGGGVANERFCEELEKVLANIEDPNTDGAATRSITLTVTIKPQKDRERAAIKVACSSKLAAVNTFVTQAVMGRHGGKFRVFEYDPNQRTIEDFIKEKTENVQSINQKPAATEPAAAEGSA